YPNLHTLLDAAMFLLSTLLSVLFWDIGARVVRVFPKYLAATFTLTSVAELLHMLSGLDWSGSVAIVAGAANNWRPSTWPPAAYLLPIGIGYSIWLRRNGTHRVFVLVLTLAAILVILFEIFYGVPRYSPATWLGITRPRLFLVPLL